MSPGIWIGGGGEVGRVYFSGFILKRNLKKIMFSIEYEKSVM